MNQELTLSSRLPVYFIEELITNPDNKNKELINLLFDNKICFDAERKFNSDFFSSFAEISLSLPIVKRYEDIFLDLFYKKGRCIEMKKPYSEINLCKESRDRIYLTPDRNETEIQTLQEQHGKLKICGKKNLFEIVRPLPYQLLLKPDTNYDLLEIIKPFAVGSKTITVIDPYLYNKRGMWNLDLLLSRTTYNSVFIKCNDPESFPNEESRRSNRDKFQNLLKWLETVKAKGTTVEINFFELGHEERYILYDEVQVYIPGGLDFLDSNGMIKNKKRGFYIRFEKRDFEAFPVV